MIPDGQSSAVESLGAKIKRLRQELHLSQDRLAIEAHVDQSGLSKFERGKDRSMSRIALSRIASVLKLTFDELIAETDYLMGEDHGSG